MKVFLVLVYIVFFLTNLNADVNKDLNFMVSIYNDGNTHKRKLKSVSHITAKEVSKTFNTKINIIFSENEEKMIKDFIEFKKSNIILIYATSYLRNIKILKANTKNLFTIENENKFTQNYLIVNKKSNINSLKDLKNKRFIDFIGNDNYSYWLDYITRKDLGLSYKKVIKDEIEVEKEKRLILDLFFNKADFSVVSKKIYDNMTLLNPLLKKEIIILKKSEPIFMFGLGMVHKNTPQKVVDKLNEIIEDEAFKKRFDFLLTLLDRSGIKRIELKDLEGIESFYEDYQALRAR